MRMYKMPPDTRDKEKLFGGMFTLSQFICLAIGVVIGMLLAVLFNSIVPSIISVVIGLAIGLAIGLPFAVIKIRKMGNMELLRFIFLNIKFDKKIKKKIHVNENYQYSQKGGNSL